MKNLIIILISCLVLSFAETPRFNDPYYIYAGGSQIDVGNYGSPNMYDWDGDSKKDIITGQFTGGYIRFYPNINTDSNPQFSSFSYLYASGSRITLPSG